MAEETNANLNPTFRASWDALSAFLNAYTKERSNPPLTLSYDGKELPVVEFYPADVTCKVETDDGHRIVNLEPAHIWPLTMQVARAYGLTMTRTTDAKPENAAATAATSGTSY